MSDKQDRYLLCANAIKKQFLMDIHRKKSKWKVMENCYLKNLGCTNITGLIYIVGIKNFTNIEKTKLVWNQLDIVEWWVEWPHHS